MRTIKIKTSHLLLAVVLFGSVVDAFAFSLSRVYPESVAVELSSQVAVYNDGDTFGQISGTYYNSVLLSAMDQSSGCTMNIMFTPLEKDLSGTHLLMELGGLNNGVGLYLIDGVVVFVTKQVADASAVPVSLNDLDFSSNRSVAITNSYGRLFAQKPYTVAASLDMENGLLYFVLDDGRTVSGKFYKLLNYDDFSANWSGNSTLSVKSINHDSPGGLSSSAGIWNQDNAESLCGSVESALLWNYDVYTPPVEISVGLPVFSAGYDGSNTVGETAYYLTNTVLVASPDLSDGCTLSIAFTPEKSDLTGTHLLMELGGTQNGTGLYLIDGVIVFVTKQAASDAAEPASLQDLDFASDQTVAVTNCFGRLTAGLSCTATASLDVENGFLYFSADQGLDLFCRRYELLNCNEANPNWSGDLTLSVKTKSTGGAYSGNQGGMSSSAGIWDRSEVQDLEGTVERALYWNNWALPRRQIHSRGADPEVCFDGTSFWLSCTLNARDLPLLVSSDGSHFQTFKTYSPTTIDTNYDYYCVWAPDISFVSNRCLLHFSAIRVPEGGEEKTQSEFKEEGKQVTTFVAEADPETMNFSVPELLLPTTENSAYSYEALDVPDFVDSAQIIRIDAELFLEDDEASRLFYVSHDPNNSVASAVWPGRTNIITHVQPELESDRNIIEAPCVFKKDNRYYLIYSCGALYNNYCLSYVMASSFDSLTRDQGVHSLSVASFNDDVLVENTGSCSVSVRDDEYRLIYHRGFWSGSNFWRQVYWSPLYFYSDGTLVPITGNLD